MILVDVALTFGVLSLIAFGGMPSVMPEMQRLVVDVKGWTTHAQFIQLFQLEHKPIDEMTRRDRPQLVRNLRHFAERFGVATRAELLA